MVLIVFCFLFYFWSKTRTSTNDVDVCCFAQLYTSHPSYGNLKETLYNNGIRTFGGVKTYQILVCFSFAFKSNDIGFIFPLSKTPDMCRYDQTCLMSRKEKKSINCCD